MGSKSSYVCYVPKPSESASTRQQEETETDATPARSWSLLQPLSGTCLYVRPLFAISGCIFICLSPCSIGRAGSHILTVIIKLSVNSKSWPSLHPVCQVRRVPSNYSRPIFDPDCTPHFLPFFSVVYQSSQLLKLFPILLKKTQSPGCFYLAFVSIALFS